MDPLFAWIEATALSTWLRGSLWAFPIVLIAHTIGLAFLVDVAMDARLLGVAARVPLAALDPYFPVMWAGFWLNAASGVALLIAYPTKALTNPVFYVKLATIVAGLGIAVRLRAGLKAAPGSADGGADLQAGPRLQRLAALSLACWAIGIVAGRLLGVIHRQHSWLGVLLACLLYATPAWAQTGTITGQITDETGGVLPGVTVHMHAGDTEQTLVTDETGRYRIENVPQGPVEINFKLINFSTIVRNVTLAGPSLTVDATLGLSLSADVVVTGTRTFRNIADLDNPAENLVGIASAASQGAITARQLDARPLMRPAEVLEAVPGLIASQHSGEGKANQYYLRGFNLDHGSDFSATIAGVPVNLPTQAHFHGYADANLLIPELVSGVQFKKGPYFAEDGDFSAAGSSNINYVNQVERPLVSVSAGGQGYARVLVIASPRVGRGYLLAGVEAGHNDGPWELEDDLQKVNGIIRYTVGDTRNGFSLTGQGYNADWNATDQIPVRAVQQGLITRFGNVDPTDGGRTYKYSIAAEAQRAATNASTRATVYAFRYGLNLLSNFTYYLEDPIDGDQREQEDRRNVVGGRLTYRRLGTLFTKHVESSVGVQLRHDAIGNTALYKTVAARRVGTIREDEVGLDSAAVYAQSEVEWGRRLRTTLGVRGDGLWFDVASSNPLNSGSGSDHIVSPKFTAVIGPWQQTEFYVNAGTGYHSNDARGATIRVDPTTGAPTTPLKPLIRAKGAEFGVRTVRLKGLQSTAALWYLGFDSELLFVGDAGIVEASRPSRRYGLEWTNYARFAPWLTGELDISFSNARFTDQDPAGAYIPGALDRVISGAITAEPTRRLFGSLRLRHFGPRPLTEDSSVQSASTTIWNLEGGYNLSRQLRLAVEVYNLFDADVADIDYWYTSRLPGEPLEGIDDLHTHPSLPRAARLTLHVSF